MSGAHFNPVVSVVLAWGGAFDRRRVLPYALAQCAGAVLGTWLAHGMFEASLLQWSGRERTGAAQWLAEAVATAGLILVVLRAAPGRAAVLVACWIGAAYWFTASTSFANPAVTLGRMFSDSFAGIAPRDVPAFVVAQTIGAGLGLGLNRLLGPPRAC